MMPPPPPPNGPPTPPPKSADTRTQERPILGDTNLLMAVSALFALYHVMSHFGIDPCSC